MTELHVMRQAFGESNYFSRKRTDINDSILEKISDKNGIINYEGGWVHSSDMSFDQLKKIAKYHNIQIVIEEFGYSNCVIEVGRIGAENGN